MSRRASDTLPTDIGQKSVGEILTLFVFDLVS